MLIFREEIKKMAKKEDVVIEPQKRDRLHFSSNSFGIMMMPMTPSQKVVKEDLENGITIRIIGGKKFECVSASRITTYDSNGNRSVRGLGSTLNGI